MQFWGYAKYSCILRQVSLVLAKLTLYTPYRISIWKEHAHQDIIFIFFYFWQKDHESNLAKVENEAKNLEQKLRDELQQLQTDLETEKVSMRPIA